MTIMGVIKERLDKLFRESGVDAILLTNTNSEDSNFLYLSNLTSGIFEDSALVAFPGRVYLLTSPLEYGDAMRGREKIMRVIKITSRVQTANWLRKLLKGKVVGINASFLPHAEYLRLRNTINAKRIKDISYAFMEARSIKSDYEIGLMRNAVKITRKAFEGIGAYMREGITETYLAGKFNMLLSENGASDLAFKTIVAFGANSALPHHSPGSRKLKGNEFVLIDAGARYKDYCADLTRTFIYRPDEKSERYKRMAEMLELVRDAHEESMRLMIEDARANAVHEFAEDYINRFRDGRYKGRFIHSLGHSVGIDVHDGLRLSRNSETILKKGMVFSNEPGVYIPGFGGVRIEDDVLIGREATLL